MYKMTQNVAAADFFLTCLKDYL